MEKLPNEFKITVEERDLEKALKEAKFKAMNYANHCVIAQAVKRQTGIELAVEDQGELWFNGFYYYDGAIAGEIVSLFDSRDNEGKIQGTAEEELRKLLPATLEYRKEDYDTDD